MKNAIASLTAAVLTMCIGLASGSANAAALTFNGWTASGGGYSTTFSNIVSSTFTDTLSFVLPDGASGNGASNVFGLSFGSGISFSKFELWDGANLLSSGSTGGTTSSLNFTGGTAPGNYSLKIEGDIGSGLGLYSGNIVISPVPEAETYALMLAGLSLVGFSARRRKQIS